MTRDDEFWDEWVREKEAVDWTEVGRHGNPTAIRTLYSHRAVGYAVLDTVAGLCARVEELQALIECLAACDPCPTTDDPWCYFCGSKLPEQGHDEGCLWRNAKNALPHHSHPNDSARPADFGFVTVGPEPHVSDTPLAPKAEVDSAEAIWPGPNADTTA